MGSGDSKLQFRSRISELLKIRVTANNHDFWEVLFTTPLSLHDIFSLVSPTDVRELRKKQPGNLCTVVFKCIEQLFLFAQPQNFTAQYTSARNSLRLLTRILPFFFEQNTDGLIDKFFFQNRIPSGKQDEQDFVVTHLGDKEVNETLAHVMISTLIDVMFIPGFTITTSQITAMTNEEIQKIKQNYPEGIEPPLIWDGGMVVPYGYRSPSNEQIENRKDVLRCMLSVFSGTLYVKVLDLKKTENKFLSVATSPKIPHAATMFYSLLNVIMNYDPTGILPYSSVLASDPQEQLVEVAAHVLCCLLHYKPETIQSSTDQDKQEQKQQVQNVFIKIMRSMVKAEDFKLCFKGISTILNNRIDALNTYLPSSQKMVECHEEMLVILWKLLEESKDFRIYACKVEDVTQILIPLLFFIYTSRQEQAKFPLIQISSFILLLLSGQREFGVSLNKPFDQKIPKLDLPIFEGNFAELLIIVLHKVMVTDKGICRPLFDCLLTIICNISPYCKSLSMVASVKLLGLFEAFSSPKFLYASPKNHQYISLLLEIFNNLIQYQYEGNTHLVYAILRRKKVFWELTKKPDLEAILQKLKKVSPKSTQQPEQKKPAQPEQKKQETVQPEQKPEVKVEEKQSETQDEKPEEKKEEATKEKKDEKAEDTKTEEQQDVKKPEETKVEEKKDQERKTEEITVEEPKQAEPKAEEKKEQKKPEEKGFVPTYEWINKWKSRLPLQTVLTLVKILVPEVERLCIGSAATEEDVLAYLKKTTLVGLLPVPHTIIIRTFQSNEQIEAFLTTYLWGLIYLKNLNPPMFDSKTINLFTVNVVDSN